MPISYQSAELASSNSLNANECFQLGYTILQLCQHNGFINKALVRQAITWMLLATQLDSRDARPLNALAYLMLVFNQREQARKYLALALKLDRRDQTALHLQKTLHQLEQGIVETASGQQLTMVKRLDEQMRNQTHSQRLHLQKKLGQHKEQVPIDSKEVVEIVERAQTESVSITEEAPLRLLPVLSGNLEPSSQITGLVRQALGLATGNWDQMLTSALRQFQNQNRLLLNGKLDSATVMALNNVLEQQYQRSELLDGLQELISKIECSGEWPLERHYWLAEELLNRLLMADQTSPGVLSQQPEQQILSQDLGPAGQAGFVSQGQQVEWLQAFLQAQGYLIQCNGLFERQTYNALCAWQQTRGVEVNGVLLSTSRIIINQLLDSQYNRNLLAYQLQLRLKTGLEALGLIWSLSMPAIFLDWQRWLDYWMGKGLRPTLSWPDCELGTNGKLQRQGMAVMLLQECLSRYNSDISVSGHYDTATQSTIRQLQRQHKLPINGQYDHRTRHCLQHVSNC